MGHARRVIAARGIALGLLVSSMASESRAADKPDPAAILRAAEATSARMKKDAASWVAEQDLPGGGRVLVDVLKDGGRSRLAVSIAQGKQRLTTTRIVVLDDVWYVTDMGTRGKYRPYEAPTRLPLTYLYLGKAEILYPADASAMGSFELLSGGVATYRTPLAETQRAQLRAAIRGFEEIAKKGPLTAESARSLQSSRNLLERGIPLEIDTKTGIIVGHGSADRRVTIANFRWIDRVDDREFDVAGQDWADFTDDPTAGDRSNLMLIGHNGFWQPGQKAGETDARLLDVATGRMRRVPFPGANAIGGCFLKDRRQVAVMGLDAMQGRLGIYVVDLQTGENRPVGGDALAGGMTLFPAASPDGKTLAVLHVATSGRLLEPRLHLVDLATDAVRPIGEPHDMASPSWLPDGSGLVLVVRRPGPVPGQTSASVSRIGLDGTLITLRAGDMPTLIGDGRTILYLDKDSKTWRTCSLDGKDDKPYANGLAGHMFPAPSPDGQRLVMMRVGTGKAPAPVLLKLGESEGRPLTDVPGLWAWPVWR